MPAVRRCRICRLLLDAERRSHFLGAGLGSKPSNMTKRAWLCEEHGEAVEMAIERLADAYDRARVGPGAYVGLSEQLGRGGPDRELVAAGRKPEGASAH